MNSSKVYELRSYMNEETRRQANHILQCADVVIVGGAQGIEDFIKCRMKEDKLTFRYSERLYKKGIWRALNPKNWIRNWEENLKYRNNRLYMLCASAYTASDYAILGAYKGKTFKWGYFPEFKKYKIDELLNNKSGSTMKGWKYPHASLCTLGINSIIVKELVDYPDEEGNTIGTTLILRIISCFFSILMILGISTLVDGDEKLTIVVVGLYSVTLIKLILVRQY